MSILHVNRRFSVYFTRVRKSDYYSVNHTWGATTHKKYIAFYGEIPTNVRISACSSVYKVATCERPTQYFCFWLPFVASLCNFPLLRYWRLKSTRSFSNTLPVSVADFRVSRLTHECLWSPSYVGVQVCLFLPITIPMPPSSAFWHCHPHILSHFWNFFFDLYLQSLNYVLLLHCYLIHTY